LDNWIDAAFDVAMTTLGGMAPALAPGMMAIKKSYDQPLKNLAHDRKQAIQDWAISG